MALEIPPLFHFLVFKGDSLLAQTIKRQRICLQCRRPVFNPWVGKISWRREWLPTPVFKRLLQVVLSPCIPGRVSLGPKTEEPPCILLPSQSLMITRSAPAAAAAAKSLQSCPTLCHPIDSSPPGSPVPGILQARTLEWVAISFSNA